MKLKLNSAIFMASLLLIPAPFIAGCSSTGTSRATKTTNSMEKLEDDYANASMQIDNTKASLEELLRPGQPDIKKANNAYADDVKKMEKLGDKIEKHTEKMNSQGRAYFAEWESSYTNQDIRELSERRRIELRDGYAKIAESSVGVTGALKAYLTDIREIQKYLSNDLTPQGLETIRPFGQKAVTNGQNLQETIKPVLSSISQVKMAMDQGGSK